MTGAQFSALVARLEERAKRDPAGYRTRVLLFALLGNAYLFAMVMFLGLLFLLALGSIVFLKAVGIKIALVIGAFLWVVLKALQVKCAPPTGTPVTAREAPELFAEIERLRQALHAPRFHHVLVTDDFNAAIVQVPRLGLLGWDRNYLLIGLPLAKGLTVEQFRAVLAHEYGHLAGGHGRVANWIYRQRLRWMRLMGMLEAVESSGTFLFKPFLRWYAPYFSAYSYPLARANEFEADAAAARLTSPRAAAQALTGVNVVGSYLGERFWPGIQKQAEDLPAPAFAPFSGFDARLGADLDAASVKDWIEGALARKTTVDDSHPCFSERLAALGHPAALELPAAGMGADRLLGAARARIAEDFDRRWAEAVKPAWEKRFSEAQQGRARLAELNAKHAAGTALTAQESFDRACLTESAGRDLEGAITQLRALLDTYPDDPVVLFDLGKRLLARDDAEGAPLVEKAMDLDENAIIGGSQLLRDFHWRSKREAQARAWHEKAGERAELEQRAGTERSRVTTDDKFKVHGLEPAALATLLAQLRAIPGLRKVYFVQKEVKYLPHRRLYIAAFLPKGLFYRKKKAEALQARLKGDVVYPGATLIFSAGGENYRLGRRFRWMRGSRIL